MGILQKRNNMEYNWENLSLADLFALKDHAENKSQLYLKGLNKPLHPDDLKLHNDLAEYWVQLFGECSERIEAACYKLNKPIPANKVN